MESESNASRTTLDLNTLSSELRDLLPHCVEAEKKLQTIYTHLDSDGDNTCVGSFLNSEHSNIRPQWLELESELRHIRYKFDGSRIDSKDVLMILRHFARFSSQTLPTIIATTEHWCQEEEDAMMRMPGGPDCDAYASD